MDTLDFNGLSQVLNPDKKRLAYEENRHLFTKVAFDVFQLNSSPIESYWILEKGDDGKEYLVAKYEDASDTKTIESRSSWQALSDRDAKNITIFYKGTPVRRCTADEFGFNDADIHIFKKALVEQLSSNADFTKKMLNTLVEDKQKSLFQQFPELNK